MRTHLLTLFAAFAIATNATAQCDPGWKAGPFSEGMNARVYATTTWDPDGPGPLPELVIAGGTFTTAGGTAASCIARWDGTDWQPIGGGLTGSFSPSVNALTSWDPDGSGPQTPRLVAAGFFSTAGGASVNGLAMWDGATWQPIGAGLAGVNTLTTWDPDGPGPQPAVLVAAGQFTTAGGVTVNNIARWNGTSWQSFGSGVGGGFPVVLSLTTWDPDGSGPATEQLIAGGFFTSAGGSPATRIARWDGTAWQAMSTGMDNAVSSLTTWDSDGSGPLAPSLIAGGSFATASGATVNSIARWNGAAWQALGPGVSSGGTVYSLQSWDSDGPGPAVPTLVVGGDFTTAGGLPIKCIAGWNGSQWFNFNAGLAGGPLPTVFSLVSWDPDGLGPQLPQMIAAGDFTTYPIATAVSNIARWVNNTFVPMGVGPDNRVRCLLTCDFDGPGPEPTQLIAGGQFTLTGATPVFHLARWDGAAWRPFATGMNSDVYALTVWDPDGAGPLPSQLVAGGYFSSAGGVPANGVAGWDGTAWHAFGSGMNNGVHALTSWDPDGTGPQLPQLFAAGIFTTASGTTVNGVARWDGSAWQPLGTGLSNTGWCANTWDPDGAGPAQASLFIGGEFDGAAPGASLSSRIARWDGAWHPASSGLHSTTLATAVYSLTSWDPDGSGPALPLLVAGGLFGTAGGIEANNIAMWNGTNWVNIGSGTSGFVYALTSWDPDGSGPLNPWLVAGGTFSIAGGLTVNQIARWDTVSWQPLGSGVDNVVRALTTWDPDAAGPHPTVLAAGGDFNFAGTVAARFGAFYTTTPLSPPTISQQPTPVDACTGSAASLTVYAASIQRLSFQWRKNGVPINGLLVPSALTSTLSLAGLQPADSGDYSCTVTNACGSILSNNGRVNAIMCSCSADFDNDGDAGTDFDIQAFFACLGGNCCPLCGTSDFDGDGDSGTDADIESFFRVLGGGPC